MTAESIDELRGYVRVLDGQPGGRPAALRDGLRRQAERFGRFYGIDVAMNVLGDVELDEPLTTQVLQMIGESLSNIGRHTASRRATINVSAGARELRAEVINQGDGAAWRDFRPASLDRRAHSLGGRIEVAPHDGGGSAVTMTIPL
jgi:signal transduction histidine kinase